MDVIFSRGYSFLSTPSARRATDPAIKLELPIHHFYPRPPRGGRQRANDDKFKAWEFLSTPSARRATAEIMETEEEQDHISIHALREEGDRHPERRPANQEISIHALREEGDL